MQITVRHCGSALSDTYLFLLDASGNYIDKNDDYTGDEKCSSTLHSFMKKELNPGVYYIVSEGYSSNGSITVSVTGLLNEFDYPALPPTINVVNGSASGAVQIEVPSGVNGLQPNISLVYNSNSGFGLAGYGWTLSGLSTISVTGKTMFYDNTVTPLAQGNPLVLDGQRIISENSSLTLENNRTVLIKADGSNYLVFYPDGSKATYSPYISGYLWRISRYETSAGNFMEYYYDGIYPTEIRYGGNSVASTACFMYIKFSYEPSPDINFGYIGGQKIIYSKRISSIESYMDKSSYRLYELSYNNGYYKQLSKIAISSNNQRVAPLTFSYGYNTSNSVNETETTPVTYYRNANHSNSLIYSGKFCSWQSGDQVIVMPKKDSYSATDKILLYELGYGNGNYFSNTSQIEVGSDFKQLLVANVDDSPEDEIIKINENTINLYQPSIQGLLVKIKSYSTARANLKSKYLAGNFEGKAKQGILALTPGTSFMDIHYPVEGKKALYSCNGFTFNEGDIVFPMDYDGDGKTDVAHINDSGFYVYSCFSSEWKKIASENLVKSDFNSPHHIIYDYISTLLVGDINGDGKTDIIKVPLLRKTENNCFYNFYTDVSLLPKFIQYLSNGNGSFERSEYTFFNTGVIRGINFEGGAFLQDMNGDGKADLVTTEQNRIGIFYSNGEKIVNENARIIPISGQGLVTSVNSLTVNSNRFLAYTEENKVKWVNFERDERREALLTKAGYTQIEYGNINTSGQNGQPYFYTSGYGATFPYRNIKNESMYVVTGLKTASGNTVVADYSFAYTNAVVNVHGLGFCGFEQINTTDNLRYSVTTETYEPYRFGLPKKMESPVQTVENTWSVSTTETFPKNTKISMTKRKITDKLTENVAEISFKYNSCGLPESQETKKGILTEKVTTSYKTANTTNGGKINLPETKTVEQSYEGVTLRTKTTIAYNSKYLPEKITVQKGQNLDKTMSEETFVYDSFGNVSEKSVKMFGAGDLLTTKYGYSDNNGRLLSSKTNAAGQTETYSYSSRGRDKTLGMPTTHQDFKNNTTKFTYDSFGKLTKTEFPDGTVRQETFTGTVSLISAQNLKTTVTETGKPAQEITYDVFMREKSRGHAAFNGAMLCSNIEYNSKGEIYRISEAGNSSRHTIYAYDSYGRPTRITEPSGKVTTYSYSGRSTTVTENGIAKTVTLSPEGFTQSVADPAGETRYYYRPDGQPRGVTAPRGEYTSFQYDEYGRQASINDPSAGIVQFAYDKNGKLWKQTDAEGRITETVYNLYGMPETATVTKGNTVEHLTEYRYNADRMLEYVIAGGTTVGYTYDSFLRVKTKTESVNGISLTETYDYAGGKLKSVTYGGLSGAQPPTLSYEYNANGYMTHIKSGGNAIKTVNSKNSFGQTTQYTLGNGVVVARAIDANGTLMQEKLAANSTEIQNFSYSIDIMKGVMNSRKDNTRNINETFSYDNLNRLTSYTRAGQATATVEYSPTGNIKAKTDAGTMEYAIAGKPYAISRQTSAPAGGVPLRQQDITYTGFQRPSSIEENRYKATLSYGPGYRRNKMEMRLNSALQYTRYYIGDSYEKDVPASGNATERLYAGGTAYNAPAVYIRTGGGAWTLYYIHRDHLGSITAITDASGNKTAEYSFDPWGRQRNPATQQAYAPDAAPALML
ncbi:MAG: hypothetical protein LBG92_09345, partial [Prevotellaceae bacterium]|nr:hypothetical protein [Prevotellaceae bacterium]